VDKFPGYAKFKPAGAANDAGKQVVQIIMAVELPKAEAERLLGEGDTYLVKGVVDRSMHALNLRIELDLVVEDKSGEKPD
jgi:hypothetical protein